MGEYTTGYKLGECLVAEGCQVFIGMIQSGGDPEAEAGVAAAQAVKYRKVDVTVDEWVWGDSPVGKTHIHLVSAARPALTKTALGPWMAWESANLTVGGKLLVILAGQNARSTESGAAANTVMLVTSDPAAFTAARDIAQLHKRYQLAPEESVAVNKQPNLTYSNFLLGYTVAYLKRRETVRNMDNAALVYSKLLTSEQLPDYVRSDVSCQLLGDFYRLSSQARRAATEALVTADVGDYSPSSESAINILVRLADDKLLDLGPALTTAADLSRTTNRSGRMTSKVGKSMPSLKRNSASRRREHDMRSSVVPHWQLRHAC